ncbi:MAG: OFA family MFS transporter [Fibrobacterales bacterium]
MNKTKNRWLIALSAVGIHISIGSVYAYSVMVLPLNQLNGWSKADISTAFSIAILFLGLSAAFLGSFVEKKGPRISGMVAGACYALGTAGAGLGIYLNSLPLFIAAYGALGGIGLGLGYITPVSTLVKWFPDRRGLATGMAIMGFGFAAMIFGPLMTYLFSSIGIPSTFWVLAVVYGVVIIASAQYIAPPPKGWTPEGFDPDNTTSSKITKKDLAQLTAPESLKTRRFYYMWIMLFINITCGIALISVASPMAQDSIGMTAMQAASMVGLMGLFNGLGRIGWATLSDKIGRPYTYTTFFLIQIAAFLVLPYATSALTFQCIIFLIISCYGGGFSSVPAFLGDLFGTKQLSAIHGYILTAWAAAGLAGPTIASRVREMTGSYDQTLQIFVGFFIVAFAVSILMKMNIKKKEKQILTTDKEVAELCDV